MACKYEAPNCPECGDEIRYELDDVVALGAVKRVGPETYAFAGDAGLVMWNANEARLRVHGKKFVYATCESKHRWQTLKTFVRGAGDAVVEPRWVGENADDTEKVLHQSTRPRRSILKDMGKYTVAALDWDGSLLLGWVAADDGDSAIAAVSLHEAPMEFLMISPGFISEEEMRKYSFHGDRPLRKFTVTGEAEDGRPIYEWVEALDGGSAVDHLGLKFGKFMPHVVLPGHHKPSELENASKRFSGDFEKLWADSVVDEPLN